MRSSQTLEQMAATLIPGQVYRRADFVDMSSNVDRHLTELLANGQLRKLCQGLYSAPRSTPFGEALPNENSLLRAFLKDDHFVVYSQGQFNVLGLGTTQLYNERLVFNRKRVGKFTLGGRAYTFLRWREAPKALTAEFLVVQLLNRLDYLAEDHDQVLKRLGEKLTQFNTRKLMHASSHYGTLSTQKRLRNMMHNEH
ncbi:MAG: hypothetical protein WCK42_08785 [Myxococcaceae bacterium]